MVEFVLTHGAVEQSHGSVKNGLTQFLVPRPAVAHPLSVWGRVVLKCSRNRTVSEGMFSLNWYPGGRLGPGWIL